MSDRKPLPKLPKIRVQAALDPQTFYALKVCLAEDRVTFQQWMQCKIVQYIAQCNQRRQR